MRPAQKGIRAGRLDSSRKGSFQLQKPLFRASESRPFAPTVRPKPIRFVSFFYPQKGERYICMSMKLYVGNLAFATSSQELQELFGQAGTVESASVVEDRDTGRSRGFGFVEMSSKEEGEAAIAQFNGKEINGRALNVNEAKPRENRGGGGGRGFGGGGNRGGGGGYGGNRGGGGGYGGGGNREPRW
jgi:RNA recognition motif-containing protein